MEWWQAPKGRGFNWGPRNVNAHSGIDMQTPWDTLIHAGVTGTVIFAQCKPWGGQCDILTNWHGADVVLTFVHPHILYVAQGQHVTPSTSIGRTGGDGRGPCPTQMPKYSDGPHCHVELTVGRVGPYHGVSPYKPTNTNYPIDPATFIGELNGIAAPSIDQSLTTAQRGAETVVGAIPDLSAVFRVPEATMQTLDQIPGIDNLLYRLHEAEHFPGFLSQQQVLGSNAGFDPGKIAYWVVGNAVGNAKPFTVRLLYGSIGLLLFFGLLIAFANAQREKVADVVEQVAPQLIETGAA